jgi:hypothetical protein
VGSYLVGWLNGVTDGSDASFLFMAAALVLSVILTLALRPSPAPAHAAAEWVSEISYMAISRGVRHHSDCSRKVFIANSASLRAGRSSLTAFQTIWLSTR